MIKIPVIFTRLDAMSTAFAANAVAASTVVATDFDAYS